MLFRLNKDIKYKELTDLISNENVSEVLLKVGTHIQVDYLEDYPSNTLVSYNKVSKKLIENFRNLLENDFDCIHSSREYKELVDSSTKIRVTTDSSRSFIKIVKKSEQKFTLEDLLEG